MLSTVAPGSARDAPGQGGPMSSVLVPPSAPGVQAGRLPWPVLKPVGQQNHYRAIALNRPVCVVGARSAVHLALDSPLGSRAHALIVNDGAPSRPRDLAR